MLCLYGHVQMNISVQSFTKPYSMLIVKCTLHQTVLCFSFCFVVKWNFVGKGERQLSLEVGDTVHIQETCDGKNASKHS